MILLNLALKNVKQNMSQYLLYFLSTISCIVIYFIFASLKYAPTTMMKSESSAKIYAAISSVSFVIIVFVALFIWMTNTFFVRSRKKEIGIYTFCGMKPRHVSLLLFIENIVIGAISITVGLALGVLLSRLANMLLIQMMGLSTFVDFYIAPKAVIETLVSFALIFLFTSLTSAVMVYRFKIIELIQAAKSEEKVPKHSAIKAWLGLILIVLGYVDSQLIPVIPGLILVTMLSTLAITIAGTYLFFSSFTLYWLKYRRKQDGHILSGTNILATNHLMFRITHNARAMATISVLAATTITALGTSLSLAEEMSQMSLAYVPYHYQAFADETHAERLDQLMAESLPQMPFQVTAQSKQVLLGGSPQVTTTLSDYNQKYFEASDFLYISSQQLLEAAAMSPSKLPEPLAKALKQLPDNEAIFLTNRLDSFSMAGWQSNSEMRLTQNGVQLLIKTQYPDQWYPEGLFKHMVVVNPRTHALLSNAAQSQTSLYLLNVDKPVKTLALDKVFEALDESEREKLHFYSSEALKQALNADRGLNLFIAIFVCLIFVLASGSVIYFKQLTDAVGEVQKYETLFKLGMQPEAVKETLSKQLLFMFGMPYLVAVTHSAFALTSLSKLMRMPLWHIGLIACAAYLLLYGLFYVATKKSYFKVVWRYDQLRLR